MDISVFRRYEIKFLVSDEQRRSLKEAFEDMMIPDEHGESTICSVYCDTPDFRLIRTSLEKPVYKEKLRIRSYGRAAEDENVFMELKKKYKGVVYKRRITLPQYEADTFVTQGAGLSGYGQIGREIESFRSFYGTIRPAMYICYDRTAFFGKDDPGLRVTFDRNILWREDRLRLTCAPGGRMLIGPDSSLMEIKCAGSVPLPLVRLMNENGIRQTSFSKSGNAYMTMLAEHHEAVQGINERSVYCA
ncbi:MAG: polyphosphate polymerase domain-containing protein [Ruminiclostridium sp.]|nr:polyphosphate polymerase domain-containing protein [Ruminiclostridium sp.]